MSDTPSKSPFDPALRPVETGSMEIDPQAGQGPGAVSKPSRRKRWVVGIACVVVAAGAVALGPQVMSTVSGGGPVLSAAADAATDGSPTAPDPDPDPLAAPEAQVLQVRTEAVAASSGYDVAERYAGRLMARRLSSLAFERQGRLDAVHVDAGDPVTAGQALAVLDTRALQSLKAQRQAALDGAKAQVEAAQSRLELAELTTERRAVLARQRHTSQQSYDDIRLEADALRADLIGARARVGEAEAQLRAVEVDLALSSLTAPYDGVVVDRFADEGTTVAPGTAVLEIQERGVLEARIGLPSDRAALLAPGDSLLLDRGTSVSGSTLTATVRQVVDRIDAQTRTVPVILDVMQQANEPVGGPSESAQPPARPGEIVHLTLHHRAPTPGFWLPLSALAEGRRGLWVAYALEPTEEEDVALIGRREVELVHITSDRAFVRGSLSDGERLVVHGLHRLVPGQRVRDDGMSAPVMSRFGDGGGEAAVTEVAEVSPMSRMRENGQ